MWVSSIVTLTCSLGDLEHLQSNITTHPWEPLNLGHAFTKGGNLRYEQRVVSDDVRYCILLHP